MRDSCSACHRPLQHDGTAVGIEQAHPDVDGAPLSCTTCHGGDPDARAQSEAHVQPDGLATEYLRDLTSGELDGVYRDNPSYLRFVNPGDLRVAPQSCGAGGGLSCHADTVERVQRSMMATFVGEMNVVRYRAGMQDTPTAVYGIRETFDPEWFEGVAPSTVGSLQALPDAVVAPGEQAIGPYQDVYLTKACLRCHLWSFGENRYTGDYRSGGCTACHMLYEPDGLSRSADPHVDKDAPPHPARHTLTKAVTTDQCMRCHYRGGRIGPSFQGYRERGGPGDDPPNAVRLGEPLHGHDGDFYITDEDGTNGQDETPPDVHFDAGMHCIDCHTEAAVHGDGRLYSDTAIAVEIECEDCHGTPRQAATFVTGAGRPLEHLHRDDQGAVWLTGKIDGVRRRVPQVFDALQRSPDPSSPVQQAMGTWPSGFNHAEELECYTCHSAWIPNCYGCHVTVDMQQQQRSLVSGATTAGLVTGTRGAVTVDQLVLMINHEGRIAPSMPTERMFFTAIDADGVTQIDNAVRLGAPGAAAAGGPPGHGQRAFQPHTVRRVTRFGQCRTCHPSEDPAVGDGQARITAGFGSGRFLEVDGTGRQWILDQTVDPETFEPTVTVGHPEPVESRPLPRDVIERMLGVVVP